MVAQKLSRRQCIYHIHLNLFGSDCEIGCASLSTDKQYDGYIQRGRSPVSLFVIIPEGPNNVQISTTLTFVDMISSARHP